MNLDPPTSTVAALGLLALLGGVAYANSLGNGFAFDDIVMIEQNVLIKRLDYLPTLLTSDYWAGRRAPSEVVPWKSGLYRPLVLLTYALNYAVGGLNPLGYHLVNLVLHLLVTALVYLVALRMGMGQEAALVAAAIFAVHPLHTEAVTGIVGRAELLMAAGVLGSLWLADAGRPVMSLLAFALAMFAKEQAMVLPAVLVLYDLCVVRPRSVLLRYGGYALVLAAYLLIRALVLGRVNTVSVFFLDNPLPHLDGYLWTLNAMKVAGHYLWLCIWPVSLSADYSYNAIPLAGSLLEPGVVLGILGWSGLVGVAAWSFVRGTRRACFAVGLMVVSFLPASNLLIPIGTIMGERLFYLPSAGLCLLVGLVYERATGQQSAVSGQPSAPLVTRHLSLLLVVLICLAMTVRTVARNQDWASTETLMGSAAQVVPESAKVHAALGGVALVKQDWSKAFEHFHRATELYPDYIHTAVTINLNLGTALLKTGQTTDAIQAFERAVALDPGSSVTQFNLALGYTERGLYAVAEKVMRSALALNPEFPEAHSGLSSILIELQRYDEALGEAEAALQLRPDLREAHANRAKALQALGKFDEAATESKRAGAEVLVPGLMGRKAR